MISVGVDSLSVGAIVNTVTKDRSPQPELSCCQVLDTDHEGRVIPYRCRRCRYFSGWDQCEIVMPQFPRPSQVLLHSGPENQRNPSTSVSLRVQLLDTDHGGYVNQADIVGVDLLQIGVSNDYPWIYR